MFCLKCGAELPAHASVCALCGSPVTTSASRDEPSSRGTPDIFGGPSSGYSGSAESSGSFVVVAPTPLVASDRWALLWQRWTAAGPRARITAPLLLALAVLVADLVLPIPWLYFEGVGFSARYLLGPLVLVPILFCVGAAACALVPRLTGVVELRLAPLLLGTGVLGASVAVILMLWRMNRLPTFVYTPYAPSQSYPYSLASHVPAVASGAALGLLLAAVCGLALVVLGLLFVRATAAQRR